MGGELALVSSVIGLVSGMQQPSGPPDRSAEMAAERAAQEEEQRKREADERRRDREKTTEARTIEKRRLAGTAKGRTTLANGGAGLTDEPEVAARHLKTKLGE